MVFLRLFIDIFGNIIDIHVIKKLTYEIKYSVISARLANVVYPISLYVPAIIKWLYKQLSDFSSKCCSDIRKINNAQNATYHIQVLLTK